MKRFNKQEYNIKRLQPKAEDIEINRCPHKEIDDESKCTCCKTLIETDLDLSTLLCVAETMISYLESMKIVASDVLTNKEFKEANKYFNMIPLLKNIGNLYDICSEANEEALKIEDEISEDKANLIKLILKRSEEGNPLPITVDGDFVGDMLKYCSTQPYEEPEIDPEEHAKTVQEFEEQTKTTQELKESEEMFDLGISE